MRRTALFLLAATLVVLVLLPASAFAVEAEPDMIEDPIEAVEPLDDPAVDPIAPAPSGEVGALDDPAIAQTAGIADANLDTSAARAPAAPAPVGSGSLPFTGSDSGSLAVLFLVGSLLVLCGITAASWGRAAALPTR